MNTPYLRRIAVLLLVSGTGLLGGCKTIFGFDAKAEAARNDALRQRASDAERQVQDVERRNASLSVRREELRQSIDRVARTIDDMQQRAKAARARANDSAAAAAMAEPLRRLASIRAEILKLRAQSYGGDDAALAADRQQIAELQSEIERLRVSLARLMQLAVDEEP